MFTTVYEIFHIFDTSTFVLNLSTSLWKYDETRAFRFFALPTYIIVPDVVGKTVKEATKELYPLEVEYSGTGEKVIEQSPSAGTKVETTSKVRLMLTS